MRKKNNFVKQIVALTMTAVMVLGTADMTAFPVSAKQLPVLQTVSENTTGNLKTGEGDQVSDVVLFSNTASNVTAKTKSVSYEYRSYDETSGKVNTEQKNAVANVLDQSYVDQAVNANGELYINEGAGYDTTAFWVVNGDVKIDGCLIFCGNVTLVLEDGATLKVDKTYLQCGQLTICGQENDSGQYIGKSICNYRNEKNSPRLEISGGTIEMKGGSIDNYTSVAIGSNGAYTTVVINGGTVNAEINGDFAAIGGTGNNDHTDEDKKGSFGSVEIHGGTVTAVTNNSKGITNNAAAIGRGVQGVKGSVIITGGTVEAKYDITYEYLRSTTPAICAENMQIKNVKLQGYGDNEASAEKNKLSYLYMETAFSKHYISLAECTHSGGKQKYVSGQSIMDGCVDCGAGETLCYKLTGFALDGNEATLTEERQYGEKQTTLAAVLQGADGNPVKGNVTWKWYDNNTAISGATENTYTIPSKLPVGTHVFRVEATIDGLTLIGDNMTVNVNKRTVGIDWGQTEFYYAGPKTEYIIAPKLTNAVEGDDISLQFETKRDYTVTINGTVYNKKSFPATKRSKVGTYCNAVELTGAAQDNYQLEGGKNYALCQWFVKYFTDAEASISGTQDAGGNYTGRAKLTAPDGTLLHVDGKNVKFQYYSGEGAHMVSYYLVKEDDTQYRGEDRTVSFTITADGSQNNTGEISRVKDRDIIYFGTYDKNYSSDSGNNYNGSPVPWLVLDADHTNDNATDGMFVISKNGLGSRRSGYYVSTGVGNQKDWRTGQSYAGGALQAWCGDFLQGKYAQRLTTEERQLLKYTTKVKSDRNVTLDATLWESYGFEKSEASKPGGAQFLFTNVQGVQMFLPSVEEVGLENEAVKAWDDANFPVTTSGYFTSKKDRSIDEGAYWLRNWHQSRKNDVSATYEHSYIFAKMTTDGEYIFGNTLGAELQMRPAANILFSKIWFLSDVKGKSNKKFDKGIAAYSVPEGTDHWKITMKDSTVSQFAASKDKLDDGELTISYTDARTGKNRYLSAVIEDETGAVTFYGRLKSLASDKDKSGKVTFEIPEGVKQGERVFVYEEQFNGDYLVDYAGAPVQVYQLMTPEVSVKANTGLVYNGKEQELVTLAKLKNGTIYYRLGADGTWKSGIPKGKNAGDYTVYYWVDGGSLYDNIGSEAKPRSVKVTIKKEMIAPDAPGSVMSVGNSMKTVGQVKLPDGWEWKQSDQTKTLNVDQTVKATAIYTGAGKGNYQTESVEVSITRSNCDHVAGDILYTGKGEKKATCTQEGKGHRECTKCHEVIESNIVIAPDGHSFSSAWTVDRQATTTEEGSKSHHCTKCDEKTDVTVIPKLTSGGGTSGGGGGTTGGGGGAAGGGGTPVPADDTKKDDNKTDDQTDGKTDHSTGGGDESVPAAVGTEFVVDGATYRVTSSDRKKPTVEYVKAPKNAKNTVTIPKTVTKNGVTYQVTGIAGKAFYGRKKIRVIVIPDTVKNIKRKAFAGCLKLKKIIVMSADLKDKNLDKKAFADVKKNVVIQVLKKKLSRYKKLFVKKGLNRKVKVKAIKAKK